MVEEVVYTCPYVPAEWIAAYGLKPVRLMPALASATKQFGCAEGVCPFAGAFVDEVLSSGTERAVVMTTECDQMRRAYDIVAEDFAGEIFLMNVPHTTGKAAEELYRSELARLGDFLCGLGGKVPSKEKLAEVMLRYDAHRRELKSMEDKVSAAEFCRAIADFHRFGIIESKPEFNRLRSPLEGKPLALAGGPLFFNDHELFDLVEKFGGQVVFDATETGLFGMCDKFDESKINIDPTAELTRAYIGGIRSIWQRPNTGFFERFGDRLKRRAVEGIILRRLVWCDNWHGEAARIKEEFDLPVLDIDVDGQEGILCGRTVSRVEAFMEMLR